MRSNRITAIALFFIFLLGLSLLLYPMFSDYINKMHQTSLSGGYLENVSQIKMEDYTAYFEAAEEFNDRLAKRSNAYTLPDEMQEQYDELLRISETDVMAIVDIPFLGVSLPVYHGTSDDVLHHSVGHLEWSSLPVGGESTHCVLCGHRGLPSSKLFTDLDKLTVGDVFTVTVLDRVLTYEVDQIRIVEPSDVECLVIEEGKDYCTLQTCTPYGINTHRLLVRGHRIENIKAARTARITSEGIEIEPLIVAPVLAAPLLVILFLIVLFEPDGKSKKSKNQEDMQE